MTTHEGKPKRLRPWLEGQLNRGDIPGLQWIDEDRTLFRITWKHHGKQDWSTEHGRVFKVNVGYSHTQNRPNSFRVTRIEDVGR